MGGSALAALPACATLTHGAHGQPQGGYSKQGRGPFWSDLCKSGGLVSVSRKFLPRKPEAATEILKNHLRGQELFLLIAQLFYFSCSFQGGGKSARLAQTSCQRVKGQAATRRRRCQMGAVVSLFPEAWSWKRWTGEGWRPTCPGVQGRPSSPKPTALPVSRADGLPKTEDLSRTSENELHGSVKPPFTAGHPRARLWDLAMPQCQKSNEFIGAKYKPGFSFFFLL